MQGTLEKIALITGANKGIGFEVARQLGKAGCVILLGARNPALGEDAASKLRHQDLEAQFIELDLRRRETIQAAAGFIGSEFQRLDILVNNAGIADLAADGPPSTADIEAVQRIIQTNFLGTLAITQAMLPLLRKSESGRVVKCVERPRLTHTQWSAGLGLCILYATRLQRVEGGAEYVNSTVGI